ncbi:hypothetical protein JOB18_015521, partial [Solea senegalensis]
MSEENRKRRAGDVRSQVVGKRSRVKLISGHRSDIECRAARRKTAAERRGLSRENPFGGERC